MSYLRMIRIAGLATTLTLPLLATESPSARAGARTRGGPTGAGDASVPLPASLPSIGTSTMCEEIRRQFESRLKQDAEWEKKRLKLDEDTEKLNQLAEKIEDARRALRTEIDKLEKLRRSPRPADEADTEDAAPEPSAETVAAADQVEGRWPRKNKDLGEAAQRLQMADPPRAAEIIKDLIVAGYPRYAGALLLKIPPKQAGRIIDHLDSLDAASIMEAAVDPKPQD